MDALKLRVSREAIHRFAERYQDGSGPGGIVPRLQLALKLAREGKGKRRSARAGCAQDWNYVDANRLIFDVELQADKQNPEPYIVRIVTTSDLGLVVTVLPPEFRKDLHAKKKHRELRRIVDADIEIAEPAAPVDVPLPVPLKAGTSLGDKLREALIGNAA